MAIDQGESWVNLAGNGQLEPATKMPIVGQIFFRTDESSLDSDDLDAIESIAVGLKRFLGGTYGPHLQPFKLGFIGYADYRGAAAYNSKLSQRRADMVREEVDDHFLGSHSTFYWRSRYSSLSYGAGEGRERDRTLLYKDRRVDIVSEKTHRARVEFPDTEIHVSPNNPNLSKAFAMRTRYGLSVNAPVIEVAVQGLKIAIRNERTGEELKMQFAGGGASAGLPIGINRPTTYSKFTTPYYMELTDFLGEGSITGAAVFVGTTNLEFFGPLASGAAPAIDVQMNKPLVVTQGGWDFSAGVGGVTGSWERG